MPAEFIALLAPVSYALVTVCGWFGLTYASALVATLVSLASRSIMLWLTVAAAFRSLRRRRCGSLSG